MLHPSKFFEWCAIRTGIDVFEIFDDSYEYTRKYKEFCKEMNKKKKRNK